MQPNDPTQPISPQQPPQPQSQPVVSSQPVQAPGQIVGSEVPQQAYAPTAYPATPEQTPAPTPAPQPTYTPTAAPIAQPQVEAPQQAYAPTPYPSAPQPVQAQTYDPYASPGKNKKKLLMIIPAALIGIALLAGLAFGGKQIAGKFSGLELEKYSNSALKFSMEVPKGWKPEVKNEDYIKRVSFTEPVGDIKSKSEADKHYASLSVDYSLAEEDYEEISEQEYFDNVRKSLQQVADEEEDEDDKSTSSYTPESIDIESEEAVTINGLKAYKFKVKVTNYNGDKGDNGFGYGLFVYVDKQNQYDVTIGAHESEKIHGKVDSIFKSFTRL